MSACDLCTEETETVGHEVGGLDLFTCENCTERAN